MPQQRLRELVLLRQRPLPPLGSRSLQQAHTINLQTLKKKSLLTLHPSSRGPKGEACECVLLAASCAAIFSSQFYIMYAWVV